MHATSHGEGTGCGRECRSRRPFRAYDAARGRIATSRTAMSSVLPGSGAANRPIGRRCDVDLENRLAGPLDQPLQSFGVLMGPAN